ncbi:hypothetical protein ASG32_30675 [Methylobacterium sp. Leaf361]|uniref:hypothetical protein n=1 Tax=Methylobacterium sp. Leaf361 TaxID=1736352 RepID=UPI0006F8ED41|nr:hypothetical protein [Methylobacterium sp. Leaf361]KQS66492.1 hypothetical protein ASG32_30675 [Methylobacterium sp. Leaf361]
MTEDRPLPVAGNHRGVSLFADQPAERIEGVVRPAIDHVFGMTSPGDLVEYAGDARHPPEARLLAAARVEAFWELAAENRAIRPLVDLDRLRASVAGLDSVTWVDPRRYGSLLDPDGAVERAEPLPADGSCP